MFSCFKLPLLTYSDSDTDTRDSVAEGLELSPQTTATSTETIVDTVDLPPAEGSNAGWEVEEVQTKVYKEEVPDDVNSVESIAKI